MLCSGTVCPPHSYLVYETSGGVMTVLQTSLTAVVLETDAVADATQYYSVALIPLSAVSALDVQKYTKNKCTGTHSLTYTYQAPPEDMKHIV